MLALALLLGLPAEAGNVQGKVRIRSALRKKPVGTAVQVLRYGQEPESYEAGPAPASEPVDEVRNVVVYLVKAPCASATPKPGRVVQKDRAFVPYVLPVRAGATVAFPNMDPIYHGVYSVSPTRKFTLPEYPRGESRSITFEQPGVVELFCGIHPHMNAYILVLPNDRFVQPGAGHTWKLADVPAGRYTLKAWHPRLESVTRSIVVEESGTLTVDLTL